LDVIVAVHSGDKAVEVAVSGRLCLMATLLGSNDDPYVCEIGLADVHHISNVERLVPLEWITEDGSQISDDFIRYALPLIQGESQPVIENGLPKHLVLK
jgi:6-phosphofructokinase 1